MAFNVIKQIPPKTGNYYHYRQSSVRSGKTVHSFMIYVGKVNTRKPLPSDSSAFALAELKLELKAQKLIHQTRLEAEGFSTKPHQLPLHHSRVSLTVNSRSGSVQNLIQSALPPAFGYRRIRCACCQGTCSLSPNNDKPKIIPQCSSCFGFGFIDKRVSTVPEFLTGKSSTCFKCKGKGLQSGRPCPSCGGDGKTYEREFPVSDFSQPVFSFSRPDLKGIPNVTQITTTSNHFRSSSVPKRGQPANPANPIHWKGHFKIKLNLKRFPIDSSRLRKDSVSFQRRASLKGIVITRVPPIRFVYNPSHGLKKRSFLKRHSVYTVQVNRQRNPFVVHFNHYRAQAHVFLDALRNQQPDTYIQFYHYI